MKGIRRKFTISLHYFHSDKTSNHVDMFIETENAPLLETWSAAVNHGKPRKLHNENLVWQPKDAHRKLYLTFEGKLSNNRGKVRILKSGQLLDCRSTNGETLKITCRDGQISLH